MKILRTVFLILSLLFLGGIIIFATCQKEQRRPSRHLIPEGYVGWIRIDFKIKGAPPLPIEDEHYLFKIPPSGHLQTSSDMEYGWASDDDFYYYSDNTRQKLKETNWGGGGVIWGPSNGFSEDETHNITSIYMHFFVGTEEQFKKCGSERDENSERKIGRLDEETLKKCMQK